MCSPLFLKSIPWEPFLHSLDFDHLHLDNMAERFTQIKHESAAFFLTYESVLKSGFKYIILFIVWLVQLIYLTYGTTYYRFWPSSFPVDTTTYFRF